MSEAVELLVFELDDQRYALYLTAVREVVRAVALTRLPGAPGVVEGAINLRGRVVPVLDLRARFGLRPKPVDPDQHLILASAGGRLVALRTDRATRLTTVPVSGIDSAAEVTPAARQIAGVAKLPDGLVLIHDVEAFLTQAESEMLEAALEAEAARAAEVE